jgi:Ca2+/Na+ antiporter
MFIGNFIIQYFIVSAIMVSQFSYITNNVGKAYIAIIMALSTIIIEVMIHDHRYNVLSVTMYAILFCLIAIFIYYYRNQIAVDDKQYLEGMVEQHSISLLTSQEILNKTDNYHVAKLAKNIIQTQTDELELMNRLLKK